MKDAAMSMDQHNPGSLPRDAAGAVQAAPRQRFRYSGEVPASPPARAAALALDDAATALGVPGMRWGPIWASLAVAGVLVAILYRSAFIDLFGRWANDAGWSHGFVVPLIAVFFIRLKWDTLRQLTPRGNFGGLLVLTIGVCAQVLFRATGQMDMSNLTILVVLFGMVLFVFGWDFLRILWLPIGYLAFAVPPPTELYVKITTPMQGLAADLGTILLPLFGIDGQKSGTVIYIAGLKNPLNVAEACAGMRMLVAFCALAVALGYSTHRPVWEKVTLAICALPIAIICNGFRVALTGVMSVRLGEQYGQGTPHEFLGLFMLIPAMLILLGIGWILDKMFVDAPDQAAAGGGA